MKKWVKICAGAFALTLGATAGTGLTIQTANASAAYRTVKTKTYYGADYHAKSKTKSAYMWNSNHTKKLHNLKNYPKTTWYLQKSVKLTNGKSTGIYYYVQNQNRTVSGYVWRGYLTKGANPANQNTKPTAQSLAQDAAFTHQIATLFPQATESSALNTYAKNVNTHDIDAYQATVGIQKDLKVKDVYILNVKGVSRPATLSKIKTQFGKDTQVWKNDKLVTYNAANHLNDFKGGYVGSYMLSSSMGVYLTIIVAK